MQGSLLTLSALILLLSSVARAQDAPPSGTSSGATPVRPEESLPAIVARTFGVTTLRRSNSMRVYQFTDPSGAQTKPGKILLLKQNGMPQMAFRVIKTYYPEKSEFAARRVKSYSDKRILELNESFLAIEKLRDLGPYTPTPEEKRLDDRDIEELEEAAEDEPAAPPQEPLPDTLAYDPDLDAGTSPPPVGAIEDPDAQPDFLRDDLEMLEVESVEEFDPDLQWLSAGLGYFRNFQIDAESGEAVLGLFTGGGLRYGITIGKSVFIQQKSKQDSLVAEGGMAVYKILGFTPGKNDVYTVMPLTFSLRYNVMFSESFGLFLYGGMNINRVISKSQEEPDSLPLLNSMIPAVGGGMLFQIGPKWFVRVDIGLDTVGGGLVLRF